MKYRFFLFDLDNTLWDFEGNARECITELIERHGLGAYIPDPAAFYDMYRTSNKQLWEMYEAGEITQQKLRDVRFVITLEQAGVPHAGSLGPVFGEQYLELMPKKTNLVPHAREVLEYLQRKGCKMALLSNGFKQVQYHKVRNSGLDPFFENRIFISEEVGYHKPNPKIFIAAITSVNGKKKETIMVGDNFLTDIEGAQVFGIDQFFYNPDGLPCDGAPTYMGNDLRDLMDLA
ncbi:MAG: noncanonical pyrimidine nucleotidase, YjjG family [Bacteroidales bacterium]|jgi:putative hydrolase of the HAD superfamily|nr:YjjG family noncanonical pyrimidine nucleotidase [Bacteroidales bacterium]NLZ08940.1 noncanonical pyrimidine nucleotidase, YjjG family [Bacteroidales bacterium]